MRPDRQAGFKVPAESGMGEWGNGGMEGWRSAVALYTYTPDTLREVITENAVAELKASECGSLGHQWVQLITVGAPLRHGH